MKTPISWYFIRFQTATQQNTLYSTLWLSSKGTNQAAPSLGVRGQSRLKPKAFFFLNLRCENPGHFQALTPASNSHSLNTLYFALRLSSRGTNKAMLLVGVMGQSPLKLKALKKSKVCIAPFSGTLSCFKQPLTKYSLLCFKAFFQRNQA